MVRPPDRFCGIVDEDGNTARHKYRRAPSGRLETVHELCAREYGEGRKLTVREVYDPPRVDAQGRRRVLSHPYTVHTKPCNERR